jgi:predicted DNA-binding transcriptional regulator YafY
MTPASPRLRPDSFRYGEEDRGMADTSARLLRLLSLLQSRRDWTSAELAGRLGVATRTVRKDVERLRGLGYPVGARSGVGGGYRLGSGGSLPPLLLDDEEALAVAVSLGAAAGGSVTGIEEASVRALAKLQPVLPARVRRQVGAFQQYAVPTPGAGPRADPSVLTAIAVACRDRERLRFDYRSHSGSDSRREVEPYRLVHDRRRWYLVGWDVDRADWRTFRADRVTPLVPGGPRFTPRPLPPDREIAEWVARGVGTATWRYRARVLVEAPAAYVRGRLPVPVDVRPLGEDRCEFTPGSDDPYLLAVYLGMLDADFTVIDGPELVEAASRLAERYRRAVVMATDHPPVP